MKHSWALVALLFLAAADPRQQVIGHWTGTSICTAVRPACHDETASYWVKAASKPDVVTIDAGKIVDGKDEFMGRSDFRVDFAAHTLTTIPGGGASGWSMTLTWSGNEMAGTMNLPDGQVVRNIRLKKQ